MYIFSKEIKYWANGIDFCIFANLINVLALRSDEDRWLPYLLLLIHSVCWNSTHYGALFTPEYIEYIVYRVYRASLVAQRVKRLPTMQDTQVQSLGGEDGKVSFWSPFWPWTCPEGQQCQSGYPKTGFPLGGCWVKRHTKPKVRRRIYFLQQVRTLGIFLQSVSPQQHNWGSFKLRVYEYS